MPKLNVDYTYKGKISYVVDGDTYDVIIDLGFLIAHQIRIRLLDLDTPEIYGPNACPEGQTVSDYVKTILPEGKEVLLKTYKTGKYGRWLADITVDDEDLKTLIENFMIENNISYKKD